MGLNAPVIYELEYARKRPAATGWSFKTVALILLLGAAGLAVPAALALGAYFAGGSLVAGSVLFIALFALAIAAGLSRRIRRLRVLVVLGFLEQAVRLNLPFPVVLQAAADSESPRIARRLRALAEGLLAGYSLYDSLQRAMPETPGRFARLIAAGERSGQLGPVLQRLLEQERQRRQRRLDTVVLGWFYPMVIGLLLIWGLAFQCIYVLPKLRELMNDLPGETEWLSDIAYQWDWALSVFALLAALVTMFSLALNMVQTWMIPPPVLWLRRLAQRLAWLLPVTGSLAKNRGLADICQTLADSLAAGFPAPAALREAYTLDLNIVLARRVGSWRTATEAGNPLHKAAANARMPALLVGLLATTRDSAATAAALGFLARYYRGRFSRTATLVQAAWMPLIVLVMGLVVGFFAYAFIEPIRVMIDLAVKDAGVL